MNAFERKLDTTLQADNIEILQVNVGLKCNQTCTHCHLKCSPAREELMTEATMAKITTIAQAVKPLLVDITGGAPELNPNLKGFISALRRAGHPVQMRTNFTAMTEDCCRDMPEFLAAQGVNLVGSLPCYLSENVCKMRGAGVFEKSIEVLTRLNKVGYASPGGPTVDLVFNHPLGPYLPPCQQALEKDYKRELGGRYGVSFNRLLTITNTPIGRYMEDLRAQGMDTQYMGLLVESFNIDTVPGLMCRRQINIGWDGTIYDCDFNQALNLPVTGVPTHIDQFEAEDMTMRDIVTGSHCFACTAGAGSSCGGALS